MMYGGWFGNGYGHFGSWYSLFGFWHGLMMIGFFIFIVALFLILFKKNNIGKNNNNELLEILKIQYVKGHITEDEYLSKLNLIEKKEVL